jgi:GxxExxY protein
MGPRKLPMDIEKNPIDQKDAQTYAIIGAAMEVHHESGNGFLECVYQEALSREFTLRGIPFEREVELTIYYKGAKLACNYRADFICFGEVIVELKALSALSGVEEAQVLKTLKATGKQRSLIVFVIQWHRSHIPRISP